MGEDLRKAAGRERRNERAHERRRDDLVAKGEGDFAATLDTMAADPDHPLTTTVQLGEQVPSIGKNVAVTMQCGGAQLMIAQLVIDHRGQQPCGIVVHISQR